MIRVEGLTKRYGERVALDDISFDVASGQTVGLVGQNGAGKTTTMRVLTGFLKPASGEVRIADHDALGDEIGARRQVGYLPEHPPLYLEMTTRGYLDFVGRLRGLDRKGARRRIEDVAVLCGIEDHLDITLRKLSKGYRQRVGIAQAIIHDPPVLILDEPMVGIDPVQAAQTRTLIKALGRDRTVLISSHVLAEVSAVCERVIIIHAGRIVAQDRIDALSDHLGAEKRLRLRVEGPAEQVTAALRGIGALAAVRYDAPFHVVTPAAGTEPNAEILKVLVERGWSLQSMESVRMSLEAVFLTLTAPDPQE